VTSRLSSAEATVEAWEHFPRVTGGRLVDAGHAERGIRRGELERRDGVFSGHCVETM